MALYNSILEYEREWVSHCTEKMRDRNFFIGRRLYGLKDEALEGYIDSNMEPIIAVVETAYLLCCSMPDEDELDAIARDITRIEDSDRCLILRDWRAGSAKRELVSLQLGFYQRLFTKEWDVETYPEAVKGCFGSEAEYLETLERIDRAEEKYETIISRNFPTFALPCDAQKLMQDIREIRQKWAKEIYRDGR